MPKTAEISNIAAPVTTSKNMTISNAYLDIGKLVCDCWHLFPSFRLLAALLRTNRYSTVYESMVRSKSFKGCQRSRPSREEQLAIADIPSDIIAAMATRNITVRRWTQAHGVDISDLYNPDGIEYEVIELLTEDFPELYGLTPPEYKTVPIGCDRRHIFNPKKRCHIFWSNFFGIRVEHPKESEALRLFNWRKNQVVVKRRLQLLLEKGIDAALKYPSTEILPLSDGNNKSSARRIPVDPEEKIFQQELHDILKRNCEANTLIRKLAQTIYYKTDAEFEQELLIRDQLIKKYGKTTEQIHHEVETQRRKMARG